MDSIVENQTNLKTLTEGIHSKEALELVREHVLGVMGPASMAYSNTMIKMAKLQVCVFALAEIPLFGTGIASMQCYMSKASHTLNHLEYALVCLRVLLAACSVLICVYHRVLKASNSNHKISDI